MIKLEWRAESFQTKYLYAQTNTHPYTQGISNRGVVCVCLTSCCLCWGNHECLNPATLSLLLWAIIRYNKHRISFLLCTNTVFLLSICPPSTFPWSWGENPVYLIDYYHRNQEYRFYLSVIIANVDLTLNLRIIGSSSSHCYAYHMFNAKNSWQCCYKAQQK